MTIKGVDYAFGSHPAATAVKAAGYGFVCRYLSPIAANDTNGKNLLAGELRSLLAAGLEVVVVEESTAGRMRQGAPAGLADAAHAKAVTAALGIGAIPVYFACDFDAAESDQPAISAYLDAAASVIGRARTGIYGGYYPVKRSLDGGHAAWAWQTSAWSGGQWDPRAHIRQQGSVTIGGIAVDFDLATAADFGQWPRPAAPAPVAAAPFPAPASVSISARPALAVSWPLSHAADGTPSPHYRVQVMANEGGKPGAVIDGGSEVVTGNHAVIAVPHPGDYWVRVQAAGNSPFTVPKRATA